MTRYNFNITYPICDYLFGTVYEGTDGSASQRIESTRD
jgi:hypothetical protein